jgi:hypothetical protein
MPYFMSYVLVPNNTKEEKLIYWKSQYDDTNMMNQ